MSLYAFLFYVLAAIIVVSAGMAVTRTQAVHAVIYAVASFFATAVLFGLLGAPLPAVFEIIIYAGAIMVLFLFIIMLIPSRREEWDRRELWRWLPALVLCLAILACAAVLTVSTPGADTDLTLATASIRSLGRALFSRYWLVVEIVSLVLFVGLVGVNLLGIPGKRAKEETGT